MKLKKQQRERMRRAQAAFRIRKQSAHEAEKLRLAKLERGIEEMTCVFMDFAEQLLESKRLQGDIEILAKLRDSMKKFKSLARFAAEDYGEKGVTDHSRNSELHVPDKSQAGSGSSGKSSVKSFESKVLPVDDSVQTKGMHDDIESWLDTSNTSMTAGPNSLSHTTQSSIINVFGNGWTDHLPAPFTESLKRELSSIVPPPRTSLSVKLLQYTLNFAFMALNGALSPLIAEQIFHFTLGSPPKEELLFNLRWFLGPGYSEIHRLAAASDNDGLIPKLLSSQYYPVSRERKHQFLNAVEVEKYLNERDAKDVDSDVMELALTAEPTFSMPSDDIFSEMSETPSRNQPIDPAISGENEQKESNGNLDAGSKRHVSVQSTIPIVSHQVLDNGITLRKEQVTNPSSKSVEQMRLELPFRQKHRVRISSLLENLARISICLDNGPGFRSSLIDNAIILSVIHS